MVVHSPPPKATNPADSGVPPSVQQAVLDAQSRDAAASTPLLGGLGTADINLWDATGALAVQAEVHATPGEEENVNLGLATGRNNITADAKVEDPDKITVADDVQAPPPPHTPQQQAGLPQLNPFTPEWFQQLIGSAVTAAATAVANTPRPPPAASPAPLFNGPSSATERPQSA